MVVLRLDESGAAGGHGVEFGQRELAAVARPLLFVPPAERQQPLPVSEPGGPAGQQVKRRGPGADAIEPDLGVFGGADEVVVVVDQPRDHGSAAEVHHSRVRRCACQDGSVLAYRGDPLPLDRHRLADGKLLVHRDDLPVDEDESSHAHRPALDPGPLDPGPLDRAETDVICCLGSADGWGGAAMTGLLEDTIAAVGPLDAAAVAAARERQEALTKPSGSLGRLEDVSVQLAGIASQCPPPLPEPAVVAVFAADHGVHAQGVSPWPQEVTAQMVANFLASGAAVNAIATQAGAAVCVVDVGVAADLPTAQGLLSRKVRPGTADMTEGPAMTLEEARLAVETGIKVAADLVDEGYRCLITGDMGIANTTAFAALIAVFAGSTPALVTGRGTGIDDPTWARKVEVVRRALDLHRCDPASPLETLAAVGGLEHAALAGFILGGAARRVPVLLDGVIACAAAVAARAFAPQVTGLPDRRAPVHRAGGAAGARRARPAAAAGPRDAPRRGLRSGARAAGSGRRGAGAAGHGHLRQRRRLR